MLRWLWLFSFADLALAQGTTPKPKPEAYDVHAQARRLGLGAEYMVRSFGAGEQMFIAEDYLVVEVALFPPKGENVDVDPAKFTLRFNGKKAVLGAQPPSMVAASLNHPEWRYQQGNQQGRGATADLGVGGVNIGLGHPGQTSPFPGAPQSRLPAPPRAPDAGGPGGLDPKEPVKPEEVLIQTALPAGLHKGPVSGFLFFAWRGKTSSIKTLELLWNDAVLKLR
jgi:hypothetical protein